MTGFHIDRTISIGNIVTLVVVVVGAFIWLTDIDKRVGLNAAAILEAKERVGRIEARNATQFSQILHKLNVIEEALRNNK